METRSKIGLKQIQATKQAIEWFINIEDKGSKKFISLDIKNHYLSIPGDFMDKGWHSIHLAPYRGRLDMGVQYKRGYHNWFIWQ